LIYLDFSVHDGRDVLFHTLKSLLTRPLLTRCFCAIWSWLDRFLEKVVFKKGLPEFDGVRRLIVVNQFTYIQTNDFEGLPHQIGELNDAAIMTALNESDIVVLAWGSNSRFEERKAYVMGLLGDMTHKTLLRTKMHPSCGRYDGVIAQDDLKFSSLDFDFFA